MRIALVLIAASLLWACPNNGLLTPEDAIDGGPCSEGTTTIISAGSWKGSSFEALQTGDSPEIEFGSQGGMMANFDLLATGVGSKAQDLKIEFRSLDGTELHGTSSFGSVNFSCQNQAGQVLVDMTVEVSSAPFNEPIILFIEATFDVENGDPISVQSETEIILNV